MPRREPPSEAAITPRPPASGRLLRPSRLITRVVGDLRRLGGGLSERERSDLGVASRPITVVWCEDEPSIVDILSRLWGLEMPQVGWLPHAEDCILFSECGDEALALVEAHAADFFLTDACHPKGPGGQALLAGLAPRADLALGYFTGICPTDAMHRGLDFCMGKPANLSEIVEQLAATMTRLRQGTYTPIPGREHLIRAARS